MRRFLMSSFLVAYLYAVPAVAQETVEIAVIDVNQGDSILISFPAGANGQRKHMLIDGGPSDHTENRVIQFLQQKNITKLDIVVLTHPHSDHYRGLTPVLNKFPVDELWWTGEKRGSNRKEKPPKSWTSFKTAMDNSQSKVVVSQDQTRTIQGAEIEILNSGGEYPETKAGKDINNDSMVLLLRYKSVKVLFTGDIETAEGNDLVNDFCPRSKKKCRKLDVDIIKMPHHGSSHFSSKFVQFAAAEHVLVSAGHKNKQYHHPRWSALQEYQKFGAEHFYSTSAPGENHLTVTIGPSRKDFSVDDGTEAGFTYWRKKYGEACMNEEHREYCLETWQ